MWFFFAPFALLFALLFNCAIFHHKKCVKRWAVSTLCIAGSRTLSALPALCRKRGLSVSQHGSRSASHGRATTNGMDVELGTVFSLASGLPRASSLPLAGDGEFEFLREGLRVGEDILGLTLD